MIDSAKQFAEDAHKGQWRKFEGQPFVSHPKSVADSVKSLPDSSDEMVAAALLHDTVEDTEATLEEIEDSFGETVASLVGELTTDKEKRDEFGKAKYLGYKMAEMSTKALTIKLLDRWDNVNEIEETPEDFRTRYSRETRETISILEENRILTEVQSLIKDKILQKVQKY